MSTYILLVLKMSVETEDILTLTFVLFPFYGVISKEISLTDMAHCNIQQNRFNVETKISLSFLSIGEYLNRTLLLYDYTIQFIFNIYMCVCVLMMIIMLDVSLQGNICHSLT